MSSIQYRKEIDGLRAFAILPVMLFHAGVTGVTGGFAGVDVFFVISGYLITKTILSEQAKNAFGLVSFYERRARRILPALYVMLLIIIPACILWMTPEQLSRFGESVTSVGLFYSNLYFRGAIDYFAPSTEELPLLHTWSLAVEEQFYLLYPVLIMVCARFSRRTTLLILLALFVTSLGLAEFQAFVKPASRFFVPQTRMWELLLGGVLAMLPAVALDPARRFAQFLSALGMLAILASYYLLDGDTKFPGLAALPPTLGAALVIRYAAPDTLAGQLLTHRVLVGIGLISYSAYLWHQPLLALARMRSLDAPSPWLLVAICGASLVIAFASWRFVERPFRNPNIISRRPFAAVAVATLAVILATSGVIHATDGFRASYLARLDDATRAEFQAVETAVASNKERDTFDDGQCKFWQSNTDGDFMRRFDDCVARFGPAYLVVGDSHAQNLYGAFYQVSSYPFIVGIVKGGCRPDRAHDLKCPYQQVLQLITDRRQQVAHVFYTQKGSYFLTNHRYLPVNQDAIDATLSYLKAFPDASRVTWLGPQIEPGIEMGSINPLVGKMRQPDHDLIAAIAGIDPVLAGAAAQHGVAYQSKILNFDYARDFYTDGKFTYSDTNHWSTYGETLFGNRLLARLRGSGFADL